METTAMKYVKGKLVPYTIESLKKELPPQSVERPLVWFSDWDENMQWALWASVHGLLPLVCEEEEGAATLLVRHFCADSLVADSLVAPKAARILASAVGATNIRSVMIIDSEAPDYSLLRAILPNAAVTFYRADPEKGLLDIVHDPHIPAQAGRLSMPHIPGIEQYIPGDPQSFALTVIYTAGTTGEPKMFVRRAPRIAPEHVQYFTHNRALQVHVRKNLAFRLMHEALMGVNPPSYWLSVSPSMQKSPAFIDLVRDFSPTDVIGITLASYSHFLHTVAELAPDALQKVERSYVGATLLNRPLFKALTACMPDASLILAYASTETSFIGRSCLHLAKTEVPQYVGTASPVHPLHRIRIITPDESGMGEIEVEGKATGDSGRISNTACPCGAEQTLYVYGRTANDRINCAGAIFYAHEVLRVMEKLSDLVADYGLEVGEKEVGDQVLGCTRLTIIPTPALMLREDKAILIHDAFARGLRLTRTRTLRELEQDGVFLSMEIQFVQNFSDAKPLRLKKFSPEN